VRKKRLSLLNLNTKAEREKMFADERTSSRTSKDVKPENLSKVCVATVAIGKMDK